MRACWVNTIFAPFFRGAVRASLDLLPYPWYTREVRVVQFLGSRHGGPVMTRSMPTFRERKHAFQENGRNHGRRTHLDIAIPQASGWATFTDGQPRRKSRKIVKPTAVEPVNTFRKDPSRQIRPPRCNLPTKIHWYTRITKISTWYLLYAPPADLPG